MKLPKIERYNQFIWALIGTGVVILGAIGVFFAASEIIHSIRSEPGGLPVAVVDEDGKAAGQQQAAQYDFCQPIQVSGSPYQLIRVSSNRLVIRNAIVTKLKAAHDRYSEYGVYKMGAVVSDTCGFDNRDQVSAVVNVLVRDANTGAMHLALSENAVIHQLDFPTERSANNTYSEDFPPPGVLYWEIAFADSNSDGVIDDTDDIGAYLSDADGRNMKRITPEPSRVLEKTYDKSRNRLLMRVLRDSNGDGKLGEEDHTLLVESSVAQRTILREVLDNKTLSELMRSAEPKKQMRAPPTGNTTERANVTTPIQPEK